MLKVAVIRTGARSSVLRTTMSTREWEAYVDNADDITSAVSALGHDAAQLVDGLGIVDALSAWRPDVSWICSGGIQGRDPATHLPALLETLGLEYIGSSPLAAGLADNKGKAKVIVRDAGIATPDFAVVRGGTVPMSSVTSVYPVIVKPMSGMCACGVVKASDLSEVYGAVATLHRRYGDDVLVERFVDGIDITVSLVQGPGGALRCFPPVQRFFGDRADPAFAHFALPHPHSRLREGPPIAADLPAGQLATVCAMASAAFVALGLRHFARLDFRVSEGSAWFLEANHKPDLTRTSLMAFSAGLAGLDYHALIRDILANGPQRPHGNA